MLVSHPLPAHGPVTVIDPVGAEGDIDALPAQAAANEANTTSANPLVMLRTLR